MSINDRVSSLGPPRGGRIVRDAKEVIKEIAEHSNEYQTSNLDPLVEIVEQPVLPSDKPSPIEMPDLTSPYLFKFGSLTKITNRDYVLSDLYVPEGHWAQLQLIRKPALGEHATRSWIDWSSTSLNKPLGLGLQDIGMCVESYICPLKTLYWFMRAAYEQDARMNGNEEHSLFFKNFIIGELLNGGWHHADIFHYELGDPFSVLTAGVPHGHPLYYEFEQPRALVNSEIYLTRGHGAGFEDFLGKLFGDNDPVHIDEVVSWCIDGFSTPGGYMTEPSPAVLEKFCGTFRKSGRANFEIRLTQSPHEPKPAHFVIADPKDFTPRARLVQP